MYVYLCMYVYSGLESMASLMNFMGIWIGDNFEDNNWCSFSHGSDSEKKVDIEDTSDGSDLFFYCCET